MIDTVCQLVDTAVAEAVAGQCSPGCLGCPNVVTHRTASADGLEATKMKHRRRDAYQTMMEESIGP